MIFDLQLNRMKRMCRKLFWHIFLYPSLTKTVECNKWTTNGNILSFVMKGFLLFLLLGKG